MLKAQGKTVISNDYMAMANVYAKASIENSTVTLTRAKVEQLLLPSPDNDYFVSKTFAGLYFTDEENRLIDNLRANIKTLNNPYERAIAMAALIRTCIKKRPRGIFTYVGHRYDDGRKDLRTTFEQHYMDAVDVVNGSVFSNGHENKARHGDAATIKSHADLVYMDPPYYSPLSDNEYVRRYHFVEGLARDWAGVEIQENTLTKKFKSYPTPFSSRQGAVDAFDMLFKKFRDSVLMVSYSSNSQPTLDEMISLISANKNHVDVVAIDHRYSFGNQAHKVNDNNNGVKEYIFVGY
jgi:DNA adenine methylase